MTDGLFDRLTELSGYPGVGGPLELVVMVVLSLVGYHLLVFVHELGHALAIRARGLRVREFVVGDRADVVVRVAGMRMRFGRFADGSEVAGFVAPYPNRATAADIHVIALAGPAADVVSAITLLAVAAAGVLQGSVNLLIVLMAGVALLSAAINLVPSESGGWKSDGRVAQLAREAMRAPVPVPAPPPADPHEATSVSPPSMR